VEVPRSTSPAPSSFTIDPKTPLKDLLPASPKIRRSAGPLLAADLRRVPEVQFEASSGITNTVAIQHIREQMAKINHLNGKKPDGFVEALRKERPDLTGLPFAMGDACRTTGERSRQFAAAVNTVRRAMQMGGNADAARRDKENMMIAEMRRRQAVATELQRRKAMEEEQKVKDPKKAGKTASVSTPEVPSPPVSQPEPPAAEAFWDQYQNLCTQQDKAQPKSQREQCETITLARIAALTQILLPMPHMHPGLVKYLSMTPHAEATQALARLAIFSGEEETRKAAIEALKIRRERDYTAILTSGLRYPWPTVAKRAAEAIIKLERKDLLPQLIDVLEEPDPRAPVMHEVKDTQVPVVRELVRVNHHRSCLLCHAPGNSGKVSGDALTAGVPVPGQPLTPPSGGYNNSQPEILVRVDVTYLRQDFSVMQPVVDANPWPERQRFDFLVRTRELTEDEATAFRDKLKPREAGEFSPYQRAALAALRELTGRDTEPTPAAWRRLLKLPADAQRQTRTP
jgi:hypothetical protein